MKGRATHMDAEVGPAAQGKRSRRSRAVSGRQGGGAPSAADSAPGLHVAVDTGIALTGRSRLEAPARTLGSTSRTA